MHRKINCSNIQDNLRLNKRVSKNSMHFYPKFSLNKPFEKEPCLRLYAIGSIMIIIKPMLAKFDWDINATINLLKIMYYEHFIKNNNIIRELIYKPRPLLLCANYNSFFYCNMV